MSIFQRLVQWARALKRDVVVPFMFDQHFWGERLQALGAGAAPIPFARLTEERLAQAIDTACQPSMQQCAAELGVLARREDGVAAALAAIDRWL